jgi:hypothetical protein
VPSGSVLEDLDVVEDIGLSLSVSSPSRAQVEYHGPAIDLIRKRLRHTYGPAVEATYTVTGIPTDLEGARALFSESPLEFERWAVSLVDGEPNKKQVGDRGIDGRVRFHTDKKTLSTALVSVKGGQTINPGMLRDLGGVLKRERAEMGILLVLAKHTRGILEEAQASGSYVSPLTGQSYPRLQVVTIGELLDGNKPAMPSAILPYIKAQQAPARQMSIKPSVVGDDATEKLGKHDDEPDRNGLLPF